MRVRQIACDYQPYISKPPARPEKLYEKAASNDKATIDAWSHKWLANIKANKEKFGNFRDYSLGNLFGKYLHRPVICAGSGPSLKYNLEQLRDTKGIPLVSCLHNFQYFHDNGVKPDYWVTLDAGEITVDEVTEGGKLEEEEYWEATKGQVLLAYIGTSPRLLEKWRGKVYFYNAPVPDKDFRDAVNEVEPFNVWVSNGGNVLGACVYISKGYMGAGAIIYVGADFSFGYDKRFHSWNSKYDKDMGNYVYAVDVFGNKVPTWPSYNNFKSFFDYVSMEVPGIYINCTEGGTLGAYPQGNLSSIRQMDLKDCIDMYSMSEMLKPASIDPAVDGDDGRRILY